MLALCAIVRASIELLSARNSLRRREAAFEKSFRSQRERPGSTALARPCARAWGRPALSKVAGQLLSAVVCRHHRENMALAGRVLQLDASASRRLGPGAATREAGSKIAA